MKAGANTENSGRPNSSGSDSGGPQDQRESLSRFRFLHPVKQLKMKDHNWEYIATEQREQTLLLLSGALGTAEMSFHLITALESEYRIIQPAYPSTATTMADLVRGVLDILNRENADRVHVLGGSFGGLVAQCLVRAAPDRVRTIIISHSGVPEPQSAAKSEFAIKVVARLPTGLLRGLMKMGIRRLMSKAPPEQRFLRSHINDVIDSTTRDDIMSRYKVAVDYTKNYDFKPEDLVGWPGRVLIIESDDDPMVKPLQRKAIKAAYPRAQVHTFSGTGHISALVEPEQYLLAVGRFLKGG